MAAASGRAESRGHDTHGGPRQTEVLLTSAGYSGNGWSASDVKRLFQLDLLGEMLDVSRLDSRTNSTLLPGQSLVALDGSATLLNDPVNGPVLQASNGTVLWSAL